MRDIRQGITIGEIDSEDKSPGDHKDRQDTVHEQAI
jgi:hypothetical protein